jgi:SAM-dependent methyltransferase
MTRPDPRGEAVAERRAYLPLYPSERLIVPLLAAHIMRAIREYGIPAAPGAAAIDVGCGGQPLRGELEALGYRYVGVDPFPTPGVPVDHEWAVDAPEVPAEIRGERGYDLVLCTEVLEHVAVWDAAFANLWRLGVPGGRVILTCPAFYMLHEEPLDFWRPTDHALRFFADRHGFVVLRTQRLGDAFDVLGTLLGATELTALSHGRVARRLRNVVTRVKDATARAMLPSSLFRRLIRPSEGLYLANLAVLERPRDS